MTPAEAKLVETYCKPNFDTTFTLLACAQPVGGISLPARGVKTGMRSGNQVQGAVGMPLRWNTEDSKKVHMIPMSVKCVYWQSGIQLESQKGMQTRGTS